MLVLDILVYMFLDVKFSCCCHVFGKIMDLWMFLSWWQLWFMLFSCGCYLMFVCIVKLWYMLFRIVLCYANNFCRNVILRGNILAS